MSKITHRIENVGFALWTNHRPLVVSVTILLTTLIMMVLYTPLCAPGDFYVHFNRLVVLMDALKNGNFPAYMDYYIMEGYGYLIKAFYSDFLLIPFAVIGNLTSATTAYQLLIFSSTFFCGVFMYIAVKKITNQAFTGLISALLYTFCTYRIFDLYIRGALGEVLSFTFIPIIIWGSYEIIKGNYKKWYILTVGITFLCYSHLISTVLTAVLTSIFLLIFHKNLLRQKKRILYLIVSILICIPLSAYYLFPMLELMKSNEFYYNTNKLVEGLIGYRMNEMIAGLFNTVSLRNETLFPKLGGLLTFLVFTRLFIRSRTNLLKFGDLCTLIGVLLFVMTFPQFPWHIPPFSFINVIQFPWRLLEYVSLMLSISAAIYLSVLLTSRLQKIMSVGILIILYTLFFNSDSIHYRTFICMNGKPTIQYNTTFRGIIGGEYLPSKLPSNNFVYDMPEVYNDFIYHRGKVVTWTDSINYISDFYKNKGNIRFNTSIQKKDRFELPLTYYIGYRASLNDQKIEYRQSNNGLIEVALDQSGEFKIEYVGTVTQKVSFYITIISLLLFVIYIIYDTKKQKKQL